MPSFIYPSLPDSESIEFAKNLGSGWNLGNTLDACEKGSDVKAGMETEIMWGNPYTSEEMIKCVAEKGFKTVRLPVTWAQHIGTAPDYIIDAQWLDRVNEIADWALACNMYVIINVHHDDAFWLITDNEHAENASVILSKIWSQLCERFESYDERLIFEVMNEPRVTGVEDEWYGNDEYRDVVNQLNEIALETIRNSNGYNKSRYVIIPTYAASALKENVRALKLPEDDHLMVSVHYYYGTSHDASEPDCEKPLGIVDKTEIYKTFYELYKCFLSKGIGVVLGEFGWTDRTNLDNLSEKTSFYVNLAAEFGMPCMVWDNGEIFRLLDRETVEWEFDEYTKAVIVE